MVNKLSTELIEELLTPPSEASPAWEYLKDNKPLYCSLRNTYAIAHSSFQQSLMNPMLDEQASLETANRKNREMRETGLPEIVKNNTKDLEHLVWLVRVQLFSGDPYIQFAKELMLIIRCLETYDEPIQPFLTDEKVQDRTPEAATLERARAQCRSFVLLLGESSDSRPVAPRLTMLPLIGEFTDIACCHYPVNQTEDDDVGADDECQPDFQRQAAFHVSNHREEVFEQTETLNTLMSTLNELEATLSNRFQPLGIREAYTCFLEEVVTDNLRVLKDLAKAIISFPADNPENNLAKSEALESFSSHTTTTPRATKRYYREKPEWS